jgi:hypothetical protein
MVLIAAPEVLSALEKRTAPAADELISFTDADALRALEVITKRRPAVVALERLFAATPRGAALINRIKADPALIESEIRIVSHDSDYVRVSPRQPAGGESGAAEGGAGEAAGNGVTAAVVEAPAQTSAPLDQRGTRRAPRHRIAGSVDVVVDGNTAVLIDLSTLGAQVVSPAVLKPNQRVRVTLQDDMATVRFNASVAWASFEIPPKSGPRYRAGIEFLDADADAVDAYCLRHRL